MILIPAFEPNHTLIDLVTKLEKLIFDNSIDCPIAIVNDGSQSHEALSVFKALDERHHITLLNHNANRGKGAAIKTGLEYAQAKKSRWVVTADADGQHQPEDILRVLRKGIESKNKIILGVRAFNAYTPLRSKVGNVLTKTTFNIIHGGKVQDTQTGLRFIPDAYFEKLINISYNRYEFEFASLIQAVQDGNIEQIPIQTVYEPGNPSSHFNKFFDSLRIYWVLARSLVVSMSTTALDVTIFIYCQKVIESTLTCILISRTVAMLMYFYLARVFVFKTRREGIRQFLLFTSLVLINALLLSPIINALYNSTNLHKGMSYILLTSALYLVNLVIQRWIIFRD